MKDLVKRRVQQSDSEDDSSHSSQNLEAKEEQMNMEMQRIQQQLKNMPYELIINQKKAIEQGQPQPKSKPSKKEKNTPKLKKLLKKKIEKQQRKDKNDAIEVSIYEKPKYKQVKLFQEKRKTIDPRFQSYAGNYNPELAAKSFSFIPKLQQAEMKEIKSKLKGSSRKTKLNEHQKEILSKEYNRVTNDYRRFQILQLQKQTKKEIKQKYGQQFHLKKQTFKQQFQKKKLSTMNQADREKKLKEKDQQARRSQLSQRRKTLKMNPFK